MYLCIFLRGSLPWQGLKAATNKQKYEKIGEKKQTTPIKELAEGFPEEFGIYLNYVRKLGFEETPDYEFLRELFAKVMKNNNDVDDGVFDWNLLNNGKGWEASVGQSQMLAQMQNAGLTSANPHRRDDRPHRGSDRRRVSQAVGAGAAVVPPSPALVRHGSKQRRVPAALTPGSGNTPGQVTPMSAAAQVNVPVPTPPIPGRGSQTGHHPYANAAGGYEYGGDESFLSPQQQYGRASPMVPSVGAAPAISHVRARGDVGVSHGDDFHGQYGGDAQKSSLWKILTCQCG